MTSAMRLEVTPKAHDPEVYCSHIYVISQSFDTELSTVLIYTSFHSLVTPKYQPLFHVLPAKLGQM